MRIKDFLDGGGGTNLLIIRIPPKIAWKWNKLDQEERKFASASNNTKYNWQNW